LTVIGQNQLEIINEEKVISSIDENFSYLPYSPSYFSKSEKDQYRWFLSKKSEVDTEKFSWLVSRIGIKSELKSFEILHDQIDLNKSKSISDLLITNRPALTTLTVSPSGKYFLLRHLTGKSRLFDSQNGKEIHLPNKTENNQRLIEQVIGFTKGDNFFCGTQCINPMLIIRDHKTHKIKEEFLFQKLSVLPHNTIQPEYWLKGVTEKDETGLLYSTLPPPFESTNGKIAAVAVTLFQLRFLLAMVIVYDNESKFVLSQSLVDMTGWYDRNAHFLDSPDGKYFAVYDGRQKLQIFDIEKKSFVGICNIISLEKNLFMTIDEAYFLHDNKIAISICPYGDVTQRRDVLWNIKTSKFEKPFWTSDGGDKFIIATSPKGDYIATSSYCNTLESTLIPFKKEIKEEIVFWNTKNSKLEHEIKLEHVTTAFFSPDWSILEIIQYDKNNKSEIRKIIDLKKFLSPTVNLSTNDLAKSHKNFYAQNSEYRDWLSFDGQYSITARLISIDEINKIAVDKIDLDKLKNTIVTIEKKETKKLVKVIFKNLSPNDQKYILEQIIKQSKQK
jgi:hypothetical protein